MQKTNERDSMRACFYSTHTIVHGVDASRRHHTSDAIKPTKAYVEVERERLFLLRNRTDV